LDTLHFSVTDHGRRVVTRQNPLLITGHRSSLDDKLVFPAIAEVVLVSGQVVGLHQITDPGILFVSISSSSSRYAGPYSRPAILSTWRWESCHPMIT
jgi:hypothetical protein